jgi:hypothetical protein
MGVMLHAGLVARHHNIVIVAALQSAEFMSALCTTGQPFQLPVDAAFAPGQDKPGQLSKQCPVCGGLVSAFALLIAEIVVQIPTSAATPIIPPVERHVTVASLDRPVSRGPPQSL